VADPAPPPEPIKPNPPPLTQTIFEHRTEVAALVKDIGAAADPYTSNRERHYRAVANGRARIAALMIWATVGIVGDPVIVTGFLVYRGTVSGDAYTFVVGTVLGSPIAFMAEHIAPNLVTVEDADS